MVLFQYPEVNYTLTIVSGLTQPLLLGTGLPQLIEQIDTAALEMGLDLWEVASPRRGTERAKTAGWMGLSHFWEQSWKMSLQR